LRIGGGRLEWSFCDEAGQAATATNPVKERDTLRLGAKGHLSSRHTIQGESHEVASDTSSPIRRIDQDLWNRREEIPIRKYANTTNKAPPIPGTDVHGLGQRAGGVVQGVLAGPHPLCESEEIGGLKPFSENQVSHVEIDVAI